MVEQLQAQPLPPQGRLATPLDRALVQAFLRSKITVAAALVALLLVLAAILAPWIAPQDPFDLRQLNLLDSHLPPAWHADGDGRYLLGTDDQGRDVLSTILHGSRISLGVGVLSVGLAAALGIVLGLIAGYAGGFFDAFIMRIAHVLPNVIGPVLVIATINLALAIITEATLSFLGIGLPPTQPSLGTLIRIGNNFLFAGEWWIAIFPGITLALLVVAINLLGDWLRDALNPRLQ